MVSCCCMILLILIGLEMLMLGRTLLVLFKFGNKDDFLIQHDAWDNCTQFSRDQAHGSFSCLL